MTLSFMIKKRYLVEKIEEQIATGTFHERREYKPFWRKRIGSIAAWGSAEKSGDCAVFLCGRNSFKADILNITIEETPSQYADVAGKMCYNIECKFQPEELESLSAFLV